MSSKGGFLFFAYKRQILVSPDELIRISSKNIFLLFDYITNFGVCCAEGAANPKIGLIKLLRSTCKAIARN
jgi:hypothetical protein